MNSSASPTILEVRMRSLAAASAARLPAATRAMLVGPEDAPLLVVLGGISGNAAVASTPDGEPGWWSNLFGAGAPLGPDRYRILGIDFLADDEGRFAPDTFDQASIISDTLAAIDAGPPAALIGASYGGMVVLAHAQRSAMSDIPIVIISAGAAPHPMATAARSLQRRVVGLGRAHGDATSALAIARGLAMLTYRTRQEFGERFAGGIESDDPLGTSDPGRYLAARGEAFVQAMAPGRFLSLSASIDRHRIAPEHISCPALVIGVEDDQVVPLTDSACLAAQLAGPTELRVLRSPYGHDAFLKEPESIAPLIASFLARCGQEGER